MTTLNIDGENYNVEDLSDDAKAQIQSIQFVDRELTQLKMQAAVLQTARAGYCKALAEMLNSVDPSPDEITIDEMGDTITFE